MPEVKIADDDGRDIMSKAGALIDALEAEGELTAARLAEVVEEPVSSTYRLLQNLATIGWVEAGSARGRFRLGVFFIRVGAQLEDSIDVRHVALPGLHALREETGLTSFLFYRRSDRGVCVERVEGSNVRSLATQIGDSLPLYAGAAPLALFAFLPAGEQHALTDTFTTEVRPRRYPVPARKTLESLLVETRSRGYARSDEDVTLGIAALAAPVFNHRGELAAAVSVSGLREPLFADEARIVKLLRVAAAQASSGLGFEGEDEHAVS